MRKIENNTIGRLTSQDAASRSFAQQVWLQYKRNKAAMVGLIFLCVLLLIVVATYIIDFATDGAFYTENVIAQNLRARLQAPSAQHWFGCDELGRDLLYRILWGARLSLLIGFVAVAISMLFGSGLGILAGYYGGKTDAIIMRIMDVFLAIPSMVLSIAVVTGLGTSTISLLLSIAVAQVPHFARVAKAAVISVKDKGCGIPDVKKAMEPLFTTCETGERAGLGFSIMDSFMDKLRVRSREGKGTCVTLEKIIVSKGK